jgi:putative photosynthetic complex assembly protein 2
VSQIWLPILIASFVWWSSTGLILFLDGLPRRTFRRTMLGATVVMAVGCLALWFTRHLETSFGAYIAFVGALTVWGWNEMAFLTGWLTGPARSESPQNLSGFARFAHAAAMILWHELGIAAGFALVLAIGWGAENTVGISTYLLLWVMRLSAKFNIFLGVPNAPVAFLPAHLRYMASSFRMRAMNGLFPISITASTIAFALLVNAALHASDGASTGAALLATLMGLAILEHWFLVLPLQSERLWAWGMRGHAHTKLADVAASSDLESNRRAS